MTQCNYVIVIPALSFLFFSIACTNETVVEKLKDRYHAAHSSCALEEVDTNLCSAINTVPGANGTADGGASATSMIRVAWCATDSKSQMDYYALKADDGIWQDEADLNSEINSLTAQLSQAANRLTLLKASMSSCK